MATLLSIPAIGYAASRMHKGTLTLPTKQDLLDSWTQFKDGFQSRLGSVKA